MYYDAEQKRFITVTIEIETPEQNEQSGATEDTEFGNKEVLHAFV